MYLRLFVSPTIGGAGFGVVAGDPPDGLTTDSGGPVRAVVDLFETATRAWVRSTLSAVDGTYRFHMLPTTTEYFAVARSFDPSYKYETQERIFSEEY